MTMTAVAPFMQPTHAISAQQATGDESTRSQLASTLNFDLPPDLEASEPPEARGLRRDAVRLMVSHYADHRVAHTQFTQIGEHLREGDVLVMNTSGTLPAALAGRGADGTPIELHLSTHLPADLWLVELRTTDQKGSQPFFNAIPGDVIYLPSTAGLAVARLLVPYATDRQTRAPDSARLWVATLQLPMPVHAYLVRYGFPIRYNYLSKAWPLEYYQTVYATELGSAEMPSAGRAFTPELITQLMAKGVLIAPLLLHTGVSSLEAHEPPYEEWYRVPVTTANLVNMARVNGGRVIAVGTTVVRTLETVTDEQGVAHPGEGWTRVIVTPKRGLRSAIGARGGLLTGLHEPRASHLMMLEALAGRSHLEVTYAAALRQRYLWHEFGDLHLILP